jgi:hypothetical protein
MRVYVSKYAYLPWYELICTQPPAHLELPEDLYMYVCIICIGVVSAVSQYNCVYYCDTYLALRHPPLCQHAVGAARAHLGG